MKCDNCGKTTTSLYGRHLPGGAYVRDCKECIPSKFKVGDVVEFVKDSVKGNHMKGERFSVVPSSVGKMWVQLDCTCDYMHGPEELKLSSHVTPVLTAPQADPPRETPIIKCNTCFTSAKRVLCHDHPCYGNTLGLSKQVYQNDLRGWLIMEYPYRDPLLMVGLKLVSDGEDPRTPFNERVCICPKCAPQVMGTVKHMADGWRK